MDQSRRERVTQGLLAAILLAVLGAWWFPRVPRVETEWRYRFVTDSEFATSGFGRGEDGWSIVWCERVVDKGEEGFETLMERRR